MHDQFALAAALGVVAAALFLLWQVRSALLLAFAAIMVAVALAGMANAVTRWTSTPRHWSLVLVGVLLVGVVASFIWLLGTQIQSQLAELSGRLPAALQSLADRFGFDVRPPERGALGGAGGEPLPGL